MNRGYREREYRGIEDCVDANYSTNTRSQFVSLPASTNNSTRIADEVNGAAAVDSTTTIMILFTLQTRNRQTSK